MESIIQRQNRPDLLTESGLLIPPPPELYFPTDFDAKDVPHVLWATGPNGQILTLMGTIHFAKVDDPQYGTLQQLWGAFTEQTKDVSRSKIIVFREGNSERYPKESAEASLEFDGEQCTITYLAEKAGIAVEPCERPNYSEVDTLLDQFDARHVAYYYYIRNLPQLNRMVNKPTLKEFFDPNTDWGKRRLPHACPKLDFSIEAIQRTHAELYQDGNGNPLPFNESDEAFFLEQSSAEYDETIPQEIARACHMLRGKHMAETIWRYWAEGYSMFFVRGISHTRTIEPALASLPGITTITESRRNAEPEVTHFI